MGSFRRILFREALKNPRLQGFWRRIHNLTLFCMNYGGGGCIESSGENWVLNEVVLPASKRRTSPVVFDVGANQGEYSLQVRALLPKAHIYSFEPSRPTYETLQHEISAAGAGAFIFPFNIGLSNTEGTLDLYTYSVDGGEASILSSIVMRLPTQEAKIEACRKDQIEVQTIDGFCQANDITEIDLLKIDVEGHEIAVLQGAAAMIESHKINMIQFEFGPCNIYSRTFLYDFWSMLADSYHFYRIIPQGMVLIESYREQHEVFLTSNYLAVGKWLNGA
ncbi:MAG TPA: FkbM family methyltransferase [Pyrinomonadaceae bacterium]|nr:FkbM family methyltransferase [Pyrinomonadaceae bacterium]